MSPAFQIFTSTLLIKPFAIRFDHFTFDCTNLLLMKSSTID